ncbi:hypothetical protein HMPREF0762_00669 [Slackia exigua ATCC 700122]|uniref:Uncharacterized protein n=1 Tax=Slackia exigua (strain ATCC 700122 / DSM 15923 / CIP 105133 / JCM 11022 / KCTC 5966 / S-7) TaxID=649764 RepID=D0WFR8_SLAES|nr:hypothetical protein HMPREF0762_00669 [Slackia exigua ATCC 700122]
MGKPFRSSEKPHRRAIPPSRQEAVHGGVANLRPQVARAAVSAASHAIRRPIRRCGPCRPARAGSPHLLQESR